ncbi:MAG: bacteriohopanetetrol glucosamine biosynthesis glycosyltransferase HpnI [Pseudomonadota bacterium]|nr:bacteriohopanetetrol glucosamine biosynthesis glycosyltransferase HpnI [Pseudomonadota bacterium]
MDISIPQALLLIPVIAGSVYEVLRLGIARRFLTERGGGVEEPPGGWPPVSVLKPLRGLEKGLAENIRSACRQDYPRYQVVLAVQDGNDPAVPVMEAARREFPDRVELAVENVAAGINGKINNLIGALRHARHDILVISDSDVRLPEDYLRRIVAPLAASDGGDVGYVCTLYRAARADAWYEKLSLLTYNADFIPGIIFAYVTKAAPFCIGASVALRRRDLEAVGGFAALGGYLAEDYEMGCRILARGARMVLLPQAVEIAVDLPGPSGWWSGQVSWDLKTRTAHPAGFLATIITRAVPFAALFAALRLGDATGMAVLLAAVAVRMGSAAVLLGELRDREGRRALWLLPLRDVAGIFSWAAALLARSVSWRGVRYALDRRGRLTGRVTGRLTGRVTGRK